MPEVLFVGRARETDLYKQFLSRETPWVLIIIGLGGIGKTTFLHRLAEYTLKEPALSRTHIVTLDFADEELRTDPLKLLDKLTKDTTQYCDLQQIDNELKDALQQNFDSLAQLGAERVQTGASETEDPALREIHRQMRALATEAFYAQISTLKPDHLVIFLDTCEWLNESEGLEVGQWVLNELIPGTHTRIRQKDLQFSAVMASRVMPRLDVINGRDQRRLALPMLGKAEVDQYLEHMGMQDAELRQRVYEVTHGHALCVSIIGDFWQNREEQKQPFTTADFPELEEFSELALMQFTNERVLKRLKPPFKDLTRYGVVLRSFDLPLLKSVFPELLPEAEALERFNQFIRYPYIEPRGNYRYAFHELVRKALTEEVQKEVIEEWQQAIQDARASGKREYTGALLQAALDNGLKLSAVVRGEITYEQGRFNYYGVQWEEALKSYKEALTSFQEVGDCYGQAKVLQALGDVQRALARHNEALASYEQAIALSQQVGDLLGEAKCDQAAGDVQRLRNDYDAALRNYEQSLALFRRIGDQPEEARLLEAMGDVQRLCNDLDAALRSYEQALALFGELKEPAEEANVRRAIEEMQRPESIPIPFAMSEGDWQTGYSDSPTIVPSYDSLSLLLQGTYAPEIVLNGHFGRRTLGSTVVTIGRTTDRQLVLRDYKVSRLHAEIRPSDQGYTITDLGSANGTFVNEKQIAANVPYTLNLGDRIRIGDTSFTYELHSVSQSASPVSDDAYQGSISAYEPEAEDTLVASPIDTPATYPPPPPPPTSYAETPAPLTAYPLPTDPYTSTPPYSAYGSTSPPAYGQFQGAYSPTGPLRHAGFLTGKAILLIGLTLLVIAGSLGLLVQANQVATLNAQATATVQVKTRATAQAQATVTAQAQATASVIAANPNPYSADGTLALYDPLRENRQGYIWDETSNSSGGDCTFISGAYHVIQSDTNFFDYCLASNTNFSNFLYEVQMTIIRGDLGGIVFRAGTNGTFYAFSISQD